MKPSLRFEVFKRDAFTCGYCGRRSPDVVLEADHVLPKSQGGRDELDNLVTSCEECNRGKAARPLSTAAPGLNPKERAERIAEHEGQIAEYSHWLAVQREREDEEIRLLGRHFERIPGSVATYRNEPRWYWNEAQVRRWVRRLGYHEVLDSIDVTAARCQNLSNQPQENAERIWKYFCGVNWRKIKAPEGRPQL